MTVKSAQPLTPEQRSQILAEVYRELFVTCPGKESELRTLAGAAVLETRLDTLVEIVRRSTATAPVSMRWSSASQFVILSRIWARA